MKTERELSTNGITEFLIYLSYIFENAFRLIIGYVQRYKCLDMSFLIFFHVVIIVLVVCVQIKIKSIHQSQRRIQDCCNIQGGALVIIVTSTMERFMIIVNGWKKLTIIPKRTSVDVAAVLDPPLNHLIVCETRKFSGKRYI